MVKIKGSISSQETMYESQLHNYGVHANRNERGNQCTCSREHSRLFNQGLISIFYPSRLLAQIPKAIPQSITNVTRTGGVISWNKIPDSEESYGKISGYKIFIICEDQHSRNMTVSRNQSRTELRDLHSGTSYNLTVVAFNSYGEGIVSDIIGFTTRGKRNVTIWPHIGIIFVYKNSTRR